MLKFLNLESVDRMENASVCLEISLNAIVTEDMEDSIARQVSEIEISV